MNKQDQLQQFENESKDDFIGLMARYIMFGLLGLIVGIIIGINFF